ncbi:MAG: nucleoside recognition protein [Lachnospiraceae bacterium]|nr:nucleoside recognition protein [Lachnospiraceae bacterium]
MLNYLWAAMIAIGIIYAAFTGNLEAITNAALDSAGEGISLCITTAGVMALWMGLMEIAQQAGLVAKLTKGISPLLGFLFPRIPRGHKAREYIATNIIANILGLGWACTPAGLKAMEELARLEAERGNPEYLDALPQEAPGRRKDNVSNKAVGSRMASREMCTFLILNISSLQLIPVNMIAYRSQYGSTRPAAIIAPSILATLVSTLVAIIYCKCRDRRKHYKVYRGGERRAA